MDNPPDSHTPGATQALRLQNHARIDTITFTMIANPDRFQKAIDAIDSANAEDPSSGFDEDHVEVPATLLYGHRMTRWLDKLYPNSSEVLQLAARAQHIRRWEIPRSSYPMDKPGYHAWRTRLYSFHADVTEKILRDAGYDEATIERVRSLLRKEKLKADPEMQALEDVICLTFLESYFAEFAPRYDAEKVIGILRRTWAKMSPVGHAAALRLEMPDHARRLVEKALAP